MTGHVQGQFQPRPHAQFVESCSQVVLDHLFAGAVHPRNVFVGEALPHQRGKPVLPCRLTDHGAAWLHLLLDEHGRRQPHPLPPLFDARPQEQRAQVLFDRSRADAQLARDLLVAAALYQQVEDLLVTGCDLDLVEVNHGLFVCSFSSVWGSRPADPGSNLFAKYSLTPNPLRNTPFTRFLSIFIRPP